VEWVETTAGRSVYQRRGDGPGEVIRPWHVHELDRMLNAVIEAGSGRAAALDRPAAGKTGTSQNHRDAWFVGFTADYIAGVWVGNDDGTPMNQVTGGGLPARIWHDLMMEAHRGLPVRPLPGLEPPPVVLAGDDDAAPGGLDRGGFLGLLGRLLGN
jgi:penicillin-binding protein 1A